MSIIQQRNDLVEDIIDETEQFKSWDHLDLATWDAVHDAVNRVLQLHLSATTMISAEAMVGLDQKNKDRIWIEVEVIWETGRDADGFVLFLRPDGTYKNPTTLAEDYDRAMGVV